MFVFSFSTLTFGKCHMAWPQARRNSVAHLACRGAVWAAGSAIASGLFVPMLLIGSCVGRLVSTTHMPGI